LKYIANRITRKEKTKNDKGRENETSDAVLTFHTLITRVERNPREGGREREGERERERER